MLAVSNDDGLQALTFLDGPESGDPLGELRARFEIRESLEAPSAFAPLFRTIDRYFLDGQILPWDDPPLRPSGTPFQQRVWEALRAIPDGQTRTYGDLARALGLSVSHTRAIGSACAANSIAILIPCHRVVPAAGGLGGFRWGLDRKRALLDLEAGTPSFRLSAGGPLREGSR